MKNDSKTRVERQAEVETPYKAFISAPAQFLTIYGHKVPVKRPVEKRSEPAAIKRTTEVKRHGFERAGFQLFSLQSRTETSFIPQHILLILHNYFVH